MQVKTGLMNAFYTSLQTLYNIVSILIPFAVGAGLVAAGIVTAGEVSHFMEYPPAWVWRLRM